MTKRYVLTGGPSSGKSSILLALEQNGEYIVREAAEDYIKLRQAQGQQEPCTENDFQDKILGLQYQREEQIPKGIERVFIDRGVLDGLAYYQHQDREPSEMIIGAMNDCRKRPYDRIFLIENLGGYDTNAVRKENQKETLELEKLQDINYRLTGYDVKRIRPGPLEDRIKEVMKHI